MEKEAKSKDPIQQALRDHKKKWQESARAFISSMIAFKRALSGRGDPKYNLPPGDIKNPLPPEVINFLSELSSHYQLLAEDAVRIAEEQARYSQTRRKPAEHKVATASKEPKILIGDKVLPTKLAITAEEQEQGLMHVEEPTVMSFVYSQPSINRFWMKNTPQELDIVFSLNGTITNICKGEPYSTRLIGDLKYSDLIVELPYGSCEKLGITVGDRLKLL